MNKLAALTFATVADTVRTSNPSASVRANGKVMFSDSANKLIGYPKPERTFFKLGTIPGEEGIVYLVPAKEGEANVMRAAKNNDSFQFNNLQTIEKAGMQKNTRYSVEEVTEGDFTFYKLTLKTQAQKDAEDEANKTKAVKKDAPSADEIRGRMERAIPSTPKKVDTKKELDKAAVKAAKADFKKSK